MGFNTTFVTVLSQATKANNAIDKRFNTTFVTVLYHIEAVYLHEKERFNTTFVTVLYSQRQLNQHLTNVSIQLLLLFYPHFYWFLILLYHKISPKNQDFLNFLPT